jgi:hypothetical protein
MRIGSRGRDTDACGAFSIRRNAQLPVGRLKRATSCRYSERHDPGMTGWHRRNQQFRSLASVGTLLG